MKKLRLVVPSLCLIAVLAIAPATVYGNADGPQGGSNSTKSAPPPPPPPPPVQWLLDLLLSLFG